MATIRKRPLNDESQEKSNRRRRVSANKGVNFYINIEADTTPLVEEPRYTQSEVTALLARQEQAFRQLLEEKLREQFNVFNQLYIDNIFKEYNHVDCSYINW